MPKIISTPAGEENTSGSDKEYRFGYYETTNSMFRPTQEDALTWQILDPKDLTPEGESELTSFEIGHRLWTSYQVLDQTPIEAGTTASTTVYDGKGNLITATLADAAAFAVIYDTKGNMLGVVRLNSITHKPSEQVEEKRILEFNPEAYVYKGRVWTETVGLAVSRAIGDSDFKIFGVCSEATIDITNVDQLANQLKIKSQDIGTIQVISSCDGFTDSAPKQTKQGHEQYLSETLNKIKSPGALLEEELAQLLVEAAKRDGSTDNISIAIQSITNKTSAFLLGVYDGHRGSDASVHGAQNIGQEFIKQSTLTRAAYAQQDLSVNKKIENYKRDNSKTYNFDAGSSLDGAIA